MRDIPFNKMHGLGNDVVVIDARRIPVDLTPEQIDQLADRHRGVGFDQLVRIDEADAGDARLTFYNADGTEAEACGNATRCVARLLMLEMDKTELVLETKGGKLVARRSREGLVTVAMAVPRLEWDEIPLAQPCDTLDVPLEVEGLPHPVGVNMGNPHAVFFVEDVESIDIPRVGPLLEHHPMFPERANIGFATVINPTTIRLRVFERGAGLTLACGSGACAAMVAARRRSLVGDSATLILDGGPLDIAWPGHGPVEMTGSASFVFSGTLASELFGG